MKESKNLLEKMCHYLKTGIQLVKKNKKWKFSLQLNKSCANFFSFNILPFILKELFTIQSNYFSSVFI